MIEHYGEPVPIRNANMSRNSATPPAASELSSTDNLKEKILEEVIGDLKKMNGPEENYLMKLRFQVLI